MTATVVGYFEDQRSAEETMQDLLQSGFHDDQVSVIGGEGAAAAPKEESQEEKSFWDNMKESLGFASSNEQAGYEEATRRGGALVTVDVEDEERENLATDIIERHGPTDLERRLDEWHGQQAAPSSAEGTQSIPVVQEELHTGTRPVSRGAVRIHRHTSEKPVEKDIDLKEEEIYVERKPTDRAAGAGAEAFSERTIEVERMGEEPMVTKEARVVEEIEVSKEVRGRTEKVRDKVRRTDVEIEDESGRHPQ